jgi:hypothetical protein
LLTCACPEPTLAFVSITPSSIHEALKEESMKTMALRLSAFFVVALFAVGMVAQVDNLDPNIGDGSGAGGNCSICRGTYSDGVAHEYCSSPDSGGWGEQYCQVETYEGSSTCATGGASCCVD